nr:hypothetical protein Iba_chr12eCG7580 [Ipomoea batatas]
MDEALLQWWLQWPEAVVLRWPDAVEAAVDCGVLRLDWEMGEANWKNKYVRGGEGENRRWLPVKGEKGRKEEE